MRVALSGCRPLRCDIAAVLDLPRFCENPKAAAKGESRSLEVAEPQPGPLYFWSYAFYVSKYYELVDTLLAILRSSRQDIF